MQVGHPALVRTHGVFAANVVEPAAVEVGVDTLRRGRPGNLRNAFQHAAGLGSGALAGLAGGFFALQFLVFEVDEGILLGYLRPNGRNLPLRRQVGDDDGQRRRLVEFQHVHRHREGQQRPGLGLQRQLAPAFAGPAPVHQRGPGFAKARGHKLVEIAAHHLGQRAVQQLGQAGVAVEHGGIFGQQQGTFAHLLDEGAVALVGPLQGEDARPLGPLHGQRIHGPGADGVNQVLGLLQLLAQLFVGPGQLGGDGQRLTHSARLRQLTG